MSGQYKVAWLCEALLVSRSGYYDWKNRRSKPGPHEVENIHLRERIREEFARSRQTYGSPRIAYALGCPGRRNRIARLMRKERLYARQRSKYRAATTDSRHGGPIAPNRLRGLAVQRLDQIWTERNGVKSKHLTLAIRASCAEAMARPLRIEFEDAHQPSLRAWQCAAAHRF
jgi:hypothetical protein